LFTPAWPEGAGELAAFNRLYLVCGNVFQEARAERLVQDSWQRIAQVGQYDFSTTVEQIIYPAPKLTNVGDSSTREVYHVSGRADLQNRKLLASLWQNAGSLVNTQDGLEIRIEDGQAWGRLISGDWQKLDSFSTSAFAPGNDAASFLTAARNVAFEGIRRSEPVPSGRQNGPA